MFRKLKSLCTPCTRVPFPWLSKYLSRENPDIILVAENASQYPPKSLQISQALNAILPFVHPSTISDKSIPKKGDLFSEY